MASLFSDIKTPYINEATLKRVMSSRVKENIFQNIFTKPNEAVTEKFSEDTDAAEIQVIRVKPKGADGDARELGADVNGGWFNNNPASNPTTKAYGIKIINQVDDLIDIPTDQQEMMNTDLAEAELSNLAGRVYRNVNAMTFAAQLAKNLNDFGNDVGAAASKYWVTLGTTPNYLNAIIEAGAKLDDGNEDEGIDAYPDNFRAVFIRSSAKKALLEKGQIIIGGSDSAQRILRSGGFDTETRPEVATTGYLGEVDNMPVYMASKAVWSLAARYFGKTTNFLDNVEMLIVSGIGTGRALAFNSAIQIGDCPLGQGRRIKPKYRMGAECWDSMSVVPIMKNGTTLTTFGITQATASAEAKGLLTVKAPGSRS